MSKVTIGADPELFLTSSEGTYVSAVGKIGGSKRRPRKIREDGCAVQEDNVAVEFNIPACTSVDAFVESLNFNLQYLKELAATKYNLQLAFHASASFSDEELDSPAAQQFGCEPDFNAWTGMRNPRPHSIDPNLRSCGGHVHIGSQLDKVQLIKACDVTLGLWSIIHDQDMKRRDLYGKAGCFRPKKYGVEYRTLSNFWIQSESLMRDVYDRTHKAVKLVEDGVKFDEDADAIQLAINTGNLDMAKNLSAKYQVWI
jgi:hypothetical protein